MVETPDEAVEAELQRGWEKLLAMVEAGDLRSTSAAIVIQVVAETLRGQQGGC